MAHILRALGKDREARLCSRKVKRLRALAKVDRAKGEDVATITFIKALLEEGLPQDAAEEAKKAIRKFPDNEGVLEASLLAFTVAKDKKGFEECNFSLISLRANRALREANRPCEKVLSNISPSRKALPYFWFFLIFNGKLTSAKVWAERGLSKFEPWALFVLALEEEAGRVRSPEGAAGRCLRAWRLEKEGNFKAALREWLHLTNEICAR